jgi:tRNA (guanine26-N2/guanine27-N2)-dimethyltransferase
MKLKESKEGEAKLLVPNVAKPELGEIFYNPTMEFDRNISVAFARVVKPKRACDVLAATGVRGIRYAKAGIPEVYINDANPKAFELIKKNVCLNEPMNSKVIVKNMDANVLLRKEKFEFVDIDPFGSPAPFLDSAARAFRKKGFLALTATDTAPLCGTYPEVAWRRYCVQTLKTDYYQELGLRVLISFTIRTMARYEFSFTPLLAYSKAHYFRVFGKLNRSISAIDELRKEFGFVSHCFTCGWRDINFTEKCPLCKSKTKVCGEIYLGKIQDKKLCKRMLPSLGKEIELISSIINELDLPFYFDIHYLCKLLKKRYVPKLDDIIKTLEKSGFEASRTSFCKTAIKSDCGFATLRKVLLKL